jgi:phage terminase large subunit-like protein
MAIDRVKRYKKQYIFKQEEADRRINFIENECSNVKGSNGNLKLALPQKVWLETVFGFFKEIEVTKTDPDTMEETKTKCICRLIHEVPIIVSRGTGKTTLAAALAFTGQILDGEQEADIQCLAYTREQAGILFNTSRSMTSKEGSILCMLKKQDLLSSTKQGLMYRPTNSLMTIKTSNYEVLDGTSGYMNIFDEVHTYDEDFIKIVNDGSSRKRKNWLTFYITTNGIKRGKVFDKYYNKWLDILSGRIENDSVMPWIYKLDDVSEIHNPKMWAKAMPLLGITTDKETIMKDIEMSKNDPVAQAELMAKTFNLPVNSYLAYFTNEECLSNKKAFKPKLFKGSDERNARCVLGADLSDVRDICSMSFMIVEGENRHFLNKKYMPRHVIESLPKEQRDQYLKWEHDGALTIHDLDFNDQKYIFEDLKNFISENKILPLKIGYDKWNARELIRLFEEHYGNIAFEVPQTVKMLSGPLKIFKEKAKNGRLIFDDPVASWCMSNVNVKVDHNNNIFPSREKAKSKIDVFASMLDAFICYESNKEELQWYFE